MKKIKLILLSVVTLECCYAQGYTFYVTNKLPYNKTLMIKVGVSNPFCSENVQGPIKPGERSTNDLSWCPRSCFNKLEVKGDTDSHFFPVKYLDNDGNYKGLDWDAKFACSDTHMAIIGEKYGFYVVSHP